MIVAYDLDGVLAEKPNDFKKKWGKMNGKERRERKEYLMNHYINAIKLYDPPENKFFVITARKKEAKQASVYWLEKYFRGRIEGLFFLDKARTIKNVILFKTKILKRINADYFIEDNEKIVKGVRKNLPNIKALIFPKEIKLKEI